MVASEGGPSCRGQRETASAAGDSRGGPEPAPVTSRTWAQGGRMELPPAPQAPEGSLILARRVHTCWRGGASFNTGCSNRGTAGRGGIYKDPRHEGLVPPIPVPHTSRPRPPGRQGCWPGNQTHRYPPASPGSLVRVRTGGCRDARLQTSPGVPSPGVPSPGVRTQKSKLSCIYQLPPCPRLLC